MTGHEIWDVTLKIIALAGAAGWFGYRAYVGYWTTDLSIEIELTRRKSSKEAEHYVSVKTTLKRSNQGSLMILDTLVRARISSNSEERAKTLEPLFLGIDPGSARTSSSYPNQIEGLIRLATREDGNRLDPVKPDSRDAECLRLAPGDQMAFSSLFVTPDDAPVIVDVTVLGRKKFGKRPAPKMLGVGQWRASAISLPEPRETTLGTIAD